MKAVLTLLVLALSGCARAPGTTATLPEATLVAVDDPTHPVPLRALVARTPFTVLVFFSAHCDCQRAHDARLAALRARYEPREVQFLAVDSEVDATAAGDRDEARKRGYAYPLVLDSGARLAAALGADYATYSVLVERGGRVLYRGGIDSDRTKLGDHATPYLRDAIDAAVAGRPLAAPRTEALGCTLRTR